MKTALIFPGQGSQYIGMGYDFYEKYHVSRDIYQKLDNTIGRDLSKLIFSGDEKELMQTQNSQPSIMATSIAIYEAIIYENLLSSNSYSCVAGHSLGEYSALVAIKSLEFEDSVKLLKLRSKAMQESMPVGTGGMIALIGCTNEEIENLIFNVKKYGKIFIANDNTKGQIVLSGQMKAIDYIIENSKSLNVKRAIKLPVSAPFHCELIHATASEIKNEISNYEFKSFNVPLYSNVTAKICSERNIKKLLVDQVVSRVRWREIVEKMLDDGVTNFIEIGPGNVLTNLVKRTSKDIKAISISKLEDLEKLDSIVL